MALDALRYNHLAPLGFKGLISELAEQTPAKGISHVAT